MILDTKQADDTTANVPKYIPAGVFKLASATNENILVALSSDSSSIIVCMFINIIYKMVKDYKVHGTNGFWNFKYR